MSKQKIQNSLIGLTNESQLMLLRVLQNIRNLITSINPADKSSKEEILDTIDSVLQTQTQQKKRIESTILLSLETLQIFLEEGREKVKDDSETKLVQEMFILGKLLERVYIYSTDIEYAQFYNKELAIRIDNLLNEKKVRSEYKLSEINLQTRVEQIFAEMETRKVSYFKFI